MQKSFRGKLESGLIAQDYSEGRYWTAVRIPFDPVKVWPERKGMRVRGTVNGLPFRTWLFGSHADGYMLLVTRALQKKAKIAPGSIAEIVIEPDLEDRSAVLPVELAKLFKEDREVKKWFDKLNPSSRGYICSAIKESKSAEVRQRRAEQWVECMMLVREGEEVPPPILQAAFRRQPRAQIGWEKMTPTQRRGHLFSIFQCKGPDARAKRVERAIVETLRVADRKSPVKRDSEAEQ